MGATTVGRALPPLGIRPLHKLGDERLASLVNRGNDEAFAVLYERHRAALARYCRSIVGHSDDASDALQNAMLSALGALRSRRLTGRVKPWLFRIAHNESITVLRRRRGHEQLDHATPSPRAQFQDLETWEALLTDLRSLPERQRGALLMRELGGLGYDEIGSALSMSPARARKTVFEARSALSATAAGRDAECEEIRLKLSDCDGRVLRGRRVRGHLENCAACAAFALTLRDRRRVYELIPVAPVGVAAATGSIAVGGGGVAAGGVAAGGVAIGTGSAGTTLAVKGIAACALCALAGAGVALTGTHHSRRPTKIAISIQAPAVTRRITAGVAAKRASAARTPARARAHQAPRSVARRVSTSDYAPTRLTTVKVAAPARHTARPSTKPTQRGSTPTEPTIGGASPTTPTTSSRPASGQAGGQTAGQAGGQTGGQAGGPTGGQTSGPTAVPSPVAITASAPPAESQLIFDLIQSALHSASATISTAQQSALLSLEQQWQASAPTSTDQTLSSVQSLVSKILSGASGPSSWR